MRLLFFILVSLVVLGCSNSESVSVPPQEASVDFSEDSLSGMIRVKATESTIVLGTTLVEARANERPELQVKFNYDFSMGRHEVTCGEFNALMKSATGLSLDCEGDEIPATNVTYYDAVLFANERSKAEGFDTAYTYTVASFDAAKHCTNLEGFAYRSEVNAYRLPTEAEWVLAAVQNWNPQNSWTAENSDYKLHKVCGKADTSAKSGELCDMAGNAMEWVNDWLGNFRDTTLENYVGAPDGGALGQRVVKGGSYRNAVEAINLYSRGDIYTVTSSTRADYVGFRLAFGAIPDAVWMGNDGRANDSRIVPLASSATIRSLVGTYKAKLAFRNELSGNLAFIDYSGGILSVVEILDSIEVYHPEISPDGKRVAFCTGLEGVSGKSELYVRDLNADGSNLVKLKVESAAIPRWRILENGDTVIVYVTDAGNNKDDAAFKSAATWQVKFSNGKFGSPKKLFDGAYHGGISEDNTLAVTGARLLRARIAKSGSTLTEKARDTIWYKDGDDAEQACNASLSKDGSKRTLFLDFGGKTGCAFVGKSYATHERLLIADSTGTLQKSVAAPSGFTFDHSEWASGTADNVVATLTNVNGAHQKVVLVNLSDNSVVNLIEGEDLWHPCFWVSDNSFENDDVLLDLDSAGVYFNNLGGEGAIVLRYKMELLWNYKDSANVVVVGSSRPLGAINPLEMGEPFFVLNLSNVPNMMVVSEYLLLNYVIPHVKNLKYIVVSLDIDLWYHSEYESYNFFYQEYLNYPGYVYDRNHNYWKDGFPEKISRLTEESLGLGYYQNNLVASRGFNYEESNTWEKNPSVDNDSTWMDNLSANYEASLGHLKNILRESEQAGVYVIGVVFPQSPNFKKTGSFGKYGIRRSEAPALLDGLKKLEKEYPHFVFWDENKMGDHDYTDEMAANKDHLCALGATQFTSRLDSLLRTLK